MHSAYGQICKRFMNADRTKARYISGFVIYACTVNPRSIGALFCPATASLAVYAIHDLSCPTNKLSILVFLLSPYPKVIIVFSIHIIHTYFICKYRITGKHLSIMSSNMI